MYAEIMSSNGFESPWYWLLVAVIWVRALHWTFGIPHDVMRPAINGSEQAKKDAQSLLDIHVRSVVNDFHQLGTALVFLVCFVLATVATVGFVHNVITMQAITFLTVPMVILGAISVTVTKRLYNDMPEWDVFVRLYKKHRWIKLGLGFFFIIASMFWALFLEIQPYLRLME